MKDLLKQMALAFWWWALWCCSLAILPVYAQTTNLRWSSSGGGWRAMVAAMGFSNVFQQAGLFTATGTDISAISTNSGGSWFSTQFFYSSIFYEKTAMAATPQDLYDFVFSWMTTYEALSEVIAEPDLAICDVSKFGDGNFVTLFEEICEILLQFDGDWALLVDAMLFVASADYGDADFINRQANSANRIPPLQNTDLYIMTAVSPAARVTTGKKDILRNFRTKGNKNNGNRDLLLNHDWLQGDTLTYLGPINTDDEDLYTTTQGVTYTVSDTGENWYYMSDEKDRDGFLLYQGPADSLFFLKAYDRFYLYDEDPDEGELTTNNPFFKGGDLVDGGRTFNDPFGGSPNVVQLAAASSAAGAAASPASPITFAQAVSKEWFALSESIEKPIERLPARVAFKDLADIVYQSPAEFDNFAVCTQWPNDCDALDMRLLDGGYVENQAFSALISQYQLAGGTDKLKLIMTNSNTDWEGFDVSEVLQYFDSPFNDGIDPGDRVFLERRFVAMRSPQVFLDNVTPDALNAMLQPLPNSKMTTAIMNDLTTIDNPVYGIKAGLKVDFMLINLNEPISTFLVGPVTVQESIVPLSEMARSIASNTDLVQRVKAFYEA